MWLDRMGNQNQNKKIAELEARVKTLETEAENNTEILAAIFDKVFLKQSEYGDRIAELVRELGNMEGPKIKRIPSLF